MQEIYVVRYKMPHEEKFTDILGIFAKKETAKKSIEEHKQRGDTIWANVEFIIHITYLITD